MIFGYRDLAITREKVPMWPRRQHTIHFVDHFTFISFHHKVALEVVYVQVKFDWFERVVVGVVVADTAPVHEVMLRPSLTHPTI